MGHATRLVFSVINAVLLLQVTICLGGDVSCTSDRFEEGKNGKLTCRWSDDISNLFPVIISVEFYPEKKHWTQSFYVVDDCYMEKANESCGTRSDRYLFTPTSDGDFVLTIKNVTMEDSGMYTCKETSEKTGSAYKSCNFSVIGADISRMTPDEDSTSSSPLSTGAIVGIAVAVVLVVAVSIIIPVLVIYLKRRRKQKPEKPYEYDELTNEGKAELLNDDGIHEKSDVSKNSPSDSQGEQDNREERATPVEKNDNKSSAPASMAEEGSSVDAVSPRVPHVHASHDGGGVTDRTLTYGRGVSYKSPGLAPSTASEDIPATGCIAQPPAMTATEAKAAAERATGKDTKAADPEEDETKTAGPRKDETKTAGTGQDETNATDTRQSERVGRAEISTGSAYGVGHHRAQAESAQDIVRAQRNRANQADRLTTKENAGGALRTMTRTDGVGSDISYQGLHTDSTNQEEMPAPGTVQARRCMYDQK